MATNWPKPAEGSWTEHYPELGTGPISFRDSISPEFYALERLWTVGDQHPDYISSES